MKNPIVVLFANKYDIDNDKGASATGVTVSYIYGDNFNSVEHANGSKGQRPAKASIDAKLFDKFVAVPGLYDGEFDLSIGSDGKPVLKLVDANFVAPVALTPKK